ncbi:3-oxoacyl-ACP reductase family protein [Micromonospora sp. RTGN7]|uniref:SDR family NAD(P)-dependent oxidoreductase n=1 Tax=Micromonospora sp. RTGN7 TaxID=3016526 RepID=UPI0029FEF758|nr:3-oxoacyl-ACP reductase family protein [Micromonospora sp. RTGN7]
MSAPEEAGTLAGKRVLITGGTRGIGRTTALSCARRGARLVVCYGHDEAGAEETARELKEGGGAHLVVRADVTDPDEVRRLVAVCREELGGLDAVVNNAGVDGRAAIEELTPQEWERVVDIDLTAAFLVSQAALGLLADGGSIVNIGASAALRGRPHSAHYAAAKSALIGLARSLAREVGDRGIRVNTVAPGVIVTESDPGPPPPVANLIKGMTALRRLGTPEDVAGAVLFLIGDESRYVSGATLHVDGGI